MGRSNTKIRMEFHPKKRFGQNFLVDKNIQNKIIKAAGIKSQDVILEIGPGRGELTSLLAPLARKIIAVEIDSNLCAILKTNLGQFSGKVDIVNEDFLSFNISRCLRAANKIKVLSNLPYYITTPIIVRLFKFGRKIETIFITAQKEFAQRMVAVSGTSEWSAFSCFLQYHAEAKILFLIKKSCFWPQPDVDSCLVKLTPRRKLALDKRRESRLFKIIRSSFQQRRKTLRNSTSGVIQSQRLARFFDYYNIDKNIRGEKLSLEDFVNLVKFD